MAQLWLRLEGRTPSRECLLVSLVHLETEVPGIPQNPTYSVHPLVSRYLTHAWLLLLLPRLNHVSRGSQFRDRQSCQNQIGRRRADVAFPVGSVLV